MDTPGMLFYKNKTIFCFLALWTVHGCATAEIITADEAEKLVRVGHISEAIAVYHVLLEANPQAIDLRLKYADALTLNRDWEKALAEYLEVLKYDPENGEARRSIGSLQRWRGDINASKQAYLRVLEHSPGDISANLGLASAYRQDHDFANADAIYQKISQQYPNEENIKQSRYAYQREKNPRALVTYQSGITSRSYYGGVMLPYEDRKEIGMEYLREVRPDSYMRTDSNLRYEYFFGFNHSIDFRYRNAEFSYENPVNDYAAIDKFDEFFIRYTYPVRHSHVVRLRYTMRPTKLMVSGDKFVARKVEAELRSFWNARFNTTLGVGWLRDLPEDATRSSQLNDNDLIKLGFEYWFNNKLSASAKRITNPDLDSSINSTQIIQADYSINDTYSLLGRRKIDDYKTSGDETGYYLGLRYSPNQHIWSEIGLTYASRDGEDGLYPFLSMVWRF